MGATRNTGYLENLIAYDASNNVAIATSVNPSYKVTLGGSLLGTSATFSGNIIFDTTDRGLVSNTSDGSDNKFVTINGGGARGSDRGGGIVVFGNESAGTGRIDINAGDVTGGVINLTTAGFNRLIINRDGAATFSGEIKSGDTITLGAAAVGGFWTWGSTISYLVAGTGKALNLNPNGASGTTGLSIATTGAATFSSSVTANDTVTINTSVTPLRFGNLTRWGFQRPGSDNRYISFMRNMDATATPVWTVDGDNGNVGIGTSSPSVKLHVANAAAGTAAIFTNTNDSDLFINFNTSITTLMNTANAVLAFGTNNTERMRITSGGNVGIGTSNPTNKLDVNGTSNFDGGTMYMGNIDISWGYSGKGILLSKSGAGPRKALYSDSNGYLYLGYAESTGWERVYAQATSGGVYLTNGATSWTSNSDERLKNIKSNIENAVDKLSTLRTVKYSWKSDELNREYLGLIAQDVQAVLPEIVDVDKNDEIGTLGVRYTEMIPVLVKAIQEMSAQIEELKSKLN